MQLATVMQKRIFRSEYQISMLKMVLPTDLTVRFRTDSCQQPVGNFVYKNEIIFCITTLLSKATSSLLRYSRF